MPIQKKEKTQEEITKDIASTIERLSDEVSKLLNGKLNRKAILTLLAYSTKISQKQIAVVLDSLIEMKKDFLK